MKSGRGSVFIFMLLGVSGALAAAALHASAIPEAVDCTFAHPQYAGKCVEKVTPEATQTPVQACRVILDCLNNSQCVKTYCQSTTIRGGWSLVSPKEKKR
jgi:hypothetical protein